MRYVVTGGLGFVGSHVVDMLLGQYPEASFVVIDKDTYAASHKNLTDAIASGRVELEIADICDYQTIRRLIKTGDHLIHVAAESHVDNSFKSSFEFTKTNVLGTNTLLQVGMETKIDYFLHISTDEVYGENLTEIPFKEDSHFKPTNPYSASKAAAEMYVDAYARFVDYDINIIRSNNIYGIRQYPEKMLPKTVVSILNGNKAELHGDGSNRRSYLHISDFCEAIRVVLTKGERGNVYNVASSNEITNKKFLILILEIMSQSFSDSVNVVSDRVFNDSRYLIDCSSIESLGWREKIPFKQGLTDTIEWYQRNGFDHWS
jgi:UDP-glucose 4,6-dehydratase